MTLITGIIRKDYIWQSSDNRISVGGKFRDDKSVKHISIHCHDGTCILSYAGLAEVKGVIISDWIRKILDRKQNSLEQSLELIATEASNAISNKAELIMIAGAYINKVPWLYQITNLDGKDWKSKPLKRKFSIHKVEIKEPFAYFFGSGASYISNQERELLRKIIHKSPRNPKEFANLLITINKKVSSRDNERVSESCFAVFMPAKGEPVQVIGHNNKDHLLVPTVLFGIDLTDFQKQNIESLLKMRN